MTIDERTAQLILDAIAWCNMGWREAIGEEQSDWDTTVEARTDFIRFCKDRGIETVERTVIL